MGVAVSALADALVAEEIRRVVASAIREPGLLSASHAANLVAFTCPNSGFSEIEIADQIMIAAARAGVAVEIGSNGNSRPSAKSGAMDGRSKKAAQTEEDGKVKVDADHIRQRAYDIWIAEGCPAGKDVEHWARAKQELLAEGGGQPADGGEAGTKVHNGNGSNSGNGSNVLEATEPQPSGRKRLRLNLSERSAAS